MARVTIEPGDSYDYKLYVVAETGQELDLSFEPAEGSRDKGEELLLDLS
jgi:hypothetical protein